MNGSLKKVRLNDDSKNITFFFAMVHQRAYMIAKGIPLKVIKTFTLDGILHSTYLSLHIILSDMFVQERIPVHTISS